MNRQQQRKKDQILRAIAWLAILVACGVIGLQIYSDRTVDTEQVETVVTRPVLAPEEEPGFAVYFSDAHKLGFLFPKEQDPLKANPDITEALESVKTRDFVISLHYASEFSYAPKLAMQPVCRFDGALAKFTSLNDLDCNLEQMTDLSDALVYEGSFAYETTTKHVFLALVKDGQYFLEFSVEYVDDCMDDPRVPLSVCDARSEQKRSKLDAFVRSIAVKNHKLFQP